MMGFFPLRHCVQTGFGPHSAPYPKGTGSSFPRSKMIGAWSWPLTPSCANPSSFSWRGA